MHTSIPHHHHIEQVCFDVASYPDRTAQHDVADNEVGHGCKNHNEPLDDTQEFCSLYQLITVPDNLKLQENIGKVSVLNQVLPGSAVIVDASGILHLLDPASHYIPSEIIFFNSPGRPTHELRAPPIFG